MEKIDVRCKEDVLWWRLRDSLIKYVSSNVVHMRKLHTGESSTKSDHRNKIYINSTKIAQNK